MSCPDDVDSDKMPIDTTSSRTCSNTHVVCCPFSAVVYHVGLFQPAEWLLCGGQGRLLGRLASVRWVCVPAHVPDLQRWLVRVVVSLGLSVGLLKIFVCVQQLIVCTVILAVCKQKIFACTVTLSTCTLIVCVCK